MRIWAAIRSDHHIIADTVQDFPQTRNAVTDWSGVIGALCEALDLSRPVILKKHLHDILHFSRVTFKPGDFMEPVNFDRFDMEIFPEEKKK
ncbi:MAG: hypothetical protein PHC80_02675 [Eubacteriales bacterium]|nr:hypothetical protein [Eubacteriales bacterium]